MSLLRQGSHESKRPRSSRTPNMLKTHDVLWRSILLPAAMIIGANAAAFAAPVVDNVTVAPSSISVNTPTTLTFTAVITDPTVVSGDVNLLRLRAGMPQIVGVLHDDGVDGDTARVRPSTPVRNGRIRPSDNSCNPPTCAYPTVTRRSASGSNRAAPTGTRARCWVTSASTCRPFDRGTFTTSPSAGEPSRSVGWPVRARRGRRRSDSRRRASAPGLARDRLRVRGQAHDQRDPSN